MITTVTRRYKYEAEQAISDLIDRGFTIVFPLTEIHSSGTSRGSYNYRKSKYTSIEGRISSCWVAKLSKDKNDKN